jgi:hypothetical protein
MIPTEKETAGQESGVGGGAASPRQVSCPLPTAHCPLLGSGPDSVQPDRASNPMTTTSSISPIADVKPSRQNLAPTCAIATPVAPTRSVVSAPRKSTEGELCRQKCVSRHKSLSDKNHSATKPAALRFLFLRQRQRQRQRHHRNRQLFHLAASAVSAASTRARRATTNTKDDKKKSWRRCRYCRPSRFNSLPFHHWSFRFQSCSLLPSGNSRSPVCCLMAINISPRIDSASAEYNGIDVGPREIRAQR